MSCIPSALPTATIVPLRVTVEPDTYTATVGDSLIDTGNRLPSFVEEIRSCWPTGSGEDVAIWSGQPGRMRLVAVLRDDVHGVPQVTWL